MSTAYVNGRVVPLLQAEISIHDRGFTLADGIYEVIALVEGRLIDRDPHLLRLECSAAAIGLEMPMSPAALKLVMQAFVAQQPRQTGALYLQLTRGVQRRNHLIPRPQPRAGLVMYLLPLLPPTPEALAKGVQVVTTPDIRWARCNIKSTALLANVLAKDVSTQAGAKESWLLDEQGRVTEGSSSNAYIVDANGVLHTHPAGPQILGGITREVVLALARGLGMQVAEQPFTLTQAHAASEAFLTSTTNGVMPVVGIDGKLIADGKPGKYTQQLVAAYQEHVRVSIRKNESPSGDGDL